MGTLGYYTDWEGISAEFENYSGESFHKGFLRFVS